MSLGNASRYKLVTRIHTGWRNVYHSRDWWLPPCSSSCHQHFSPTFVPLPANSSNLDMIGPIRSKLTWPLNSESGEPKSFLLSIRPGNVMSLCLLTPSATHCSPSSPYQSQVCLFVFSSAVFSEKNTFGSENYAIFKLEKSYSKHVIQQSSLFDYRFIPWKLDSI